MNKLMKKVQNKKGFTLIELIVVIAIIGILVLLAAPRFIGFTKDATKATMQADAKTIANAALIYNIDKEVWPGTGADKKEIKVNGDSYAIAEPIKEDEVKELMKNTKNPVSDYVIVTEGALEGEVFYVGNDGDGVEDKKGDKHFGISLVDTAASADDNVTVDPVTP